MFHKNSKVYFLLIMLRLIVDNVTEFVECILTILMREFVIFAGQDIGSAPASPAHNQDKAVL